MRILKERVKMKMFKICSGFLLVTALNQNVMAYPLILEDGQWSVEGLCSAEEASWKKIHIVAEHFKNERFHISAEVDGKLIEKDISLNQSNVMLSTEGFSLLAGWARSAMRADENAMEFFAKEIKSNYGVKAMQLNPKNQEFSFEMSTGSGNAKCVFKPEWDEGPLKSGVVSELSKIPK